MPQVKPRAVSTLIGDVVGSRRSPDRPALHAYLEQVLAQVNEEVGSVLQPLRITVGDEFQGAFAHERQALRASLLIRLALLPAYDVRQGLGQGKVAWLDEDEQIQDGPGWWAARAAIEQVKARARGTRSAQRTWFQAAADDPGPESADERLINAMLCCRDGLVSRLDARDLVVVRGIIAGRSQQSLAQELGISASAVSQRVRRESLALLVDTDRLLGGA